MDKTFESLIESGNYNYKYIPDSFPQNKKVSESTVKVELLHLDKIVYNRDLVNEVEKQGFRLATIAEGLQFGIDNPDEQLKNCLATKEEINGRLWNLILRGNGSGRDVVVYRYYLGDVWDESFRFLVVRKSLGTSDPKPLNGPLTLGRSENLTLHEIIYDHAADINQTLDEAIKVDGTPICKICRNPANPGPETINLYVLQKLNKILNFLEKKQ